MATTTGIRECGRENGCYVSVSTLADDGDETQTGFGFSVGRQPDEFDLDKAAREAADRATRLLGATKPPTKRLDRRARPVRHGAVPRRDLLDAQRRERRQGPQPVPRPPRRAGRRRRSSRSSTTRPTRDAYTATDVDGEGLAARRNVLIDGGVLQQFVHTSVLGPARRHGVDRQRHPRRVRRHARRRLPGAAAACRAPAPRPS